MNKKLLLLPILLLTACQIRLGPVEITLDSNPVTPIFKLVMSPDQSALIFGGTLCVLVIVALAAMMVGIYNWARRLKNKGE